MKEAPAKTGAGARRGRRVLNTVDLFCGAGGATTGLELALRRLGLRHKGLAINHWRVAVDTMLANHPDVDTKQMSIEEAVPADLVPKGAKIDLLWASPSCTHHSRAKGGKPRSNQLRAQPELILTWLDQLFVRRVIVENVPEFVEWGPLGADGRPIERLKGACFRAWIVALEARNYLVEWRVLNCADYGDATTRRRFFLQAVRRGAGRIVWPEPGYAENPEPDLWGRTPKRWRGVRECLDLSDVGRSIFDRSRPLAKNTLRRIAAGLRKYCGIEFQMDMLGADGGDESRVRSLDEPCVTQAAGGNRTAIVRPFLMRFNRNGSAEDVESPLSVVAAGGQHHALCQPLVVDHFKNGEARPADAPIGAQTTHERFSVVQALAVDLSHPGDKSDASRVAPADKPLRSQTTRANTAAAFLITEQANNAPRALDAPLRSQTTVRKDFLVQPLVLGQQGGAQARPASEPCPTIATSGAIRLALPVLADGRVVDVRMRMLKPSELAAAHSFPPEYKLTGTRTEQVKQIGNSVPCRTAAALCEAALSA